MTTRLVGALVTAWSEVRAHWGRTLLGMSGIAIAIGALVTIEAAADISQRANTEHLERRVGRPATFSIDFDQDALDPEIAQTLAGRVDRALTDEGVDIATRIDAGDVILLLGDTETTAASVWMEPAFASIRHVEILAGRFFDDTDRHALETRVLLPARIVHDLGLDHDTVVGQSVRVMPLPSEDLTTAHVVGVFADHEIDSAGGATTEIYLTGGTAAADIGPMTTAESDFDDLFPVDPAPSEYGHLPSWLVRVRPEDAERFAEITGLIGESFGDTSNLTVRRLDSEATYAPIIDQQRRTLSIVALIALIVGGLSLLGIGLVTIRERRRELGVLRALGADRRHIFGAVLAEAVLTALVGMLIGLAGGLALTRAAPGLMLTGGLDVPETIGFPLRAALIGSLSALIIGIVAGLAPALRAANLEVVRAMRE